MSITLRAGRSVSGAVRQGTLLASLLPIDKSWISQFSGKNLHLIFIILYIFLKFYFFYAKIHNNKITKTNNFIQIKKKLCTKYYTVRLIMYNLFTLVGNIINY